MPARAWAAIDRPQVRRVRPADTARMRALRIEMLADTPLAFLETLAQAAARSHAEYGARIAEVSFGDEVAQFVAVAPRRPPDGGAFVGHAGGVIALPTTGRSPWSSRCT